MKKKEKEITPPNYLINLFLQFIPNTRNKVIFFKISTNISSVFNTFYIKFLSNEGSNLIFFKKESLRRVVI